MRHKESTLQINCVNWFRLAFPHYKKLLFAVPNGGQRNAATARIMKAEGTVAGVADLLLFVPSQDFHALCIEMKTETGKQSDLQKEWQTAAESQGYKYIICRSFDEFRNEITKYLKV